MSEKIEIDAKQWAEPLFMTYSIATDEFAPLTQKRLDELIATERTYANLIIEIRKMHEGHVTSLGYTPGPWPTRS